MDKVSIYDSVKRESLSEFFEALRDPHVKLLLDVFVFLWPALCDKWF